MSESADIDDIDEHEDIKKNKTESALDTTLILNAYTLNGEQIGSTALPLHRPRLLPSRDKSDFVNIMSMDGLSLSALPKHGKYYLTVFQPDYKNGVRIGFKSARVELSKEQLRELAIHSIYIYGICSGNCAQPSTNRFVLTVNKYLRDKFTELSKRIMEKV